MYFGNEHRRNIGYDRRRSLCDRLRQGQRDDVSCCLSHAKAEGRLNTKFEIFLDIVSVRMID